MENEKRMIDVNAFRKFWNNNYRHQYANETFLFALVNFPTVDAAEVVHGQWLKANDGFDIDRGWKCSHCNGSVYKMTYESYRYCPHCGAKMDGGE